MRLARSSSNIGHGHLVLADRRLPLESTGLGVVHVADDHLDDARRRDGEQGAQEAEELAGRLRDLLAEEPGAAGRELTEKKMFGGLGFMVAGNMAVAASGQGGLMVRVDPAEGGALVASTPAYPMEMRGRSMTGWLRVDLDDVASDDALAEWVQRGSAYAATLPAK
jgi:hypothetical protein